LISLNTTDGDPLYCYILSLPNCPTRKLRR
jgi:hypothetical protein